MEEDDGDEEEVEKGDKLAGNFNPFKGAGEVFMGQLRCDVIWDNKGGNKLHRH